MKKNQVDIVTLNLNINLILDKKFHNPKMIYIKDSPLYEYIKGFKKTVGSKQKQYLRAIDKILQSYQNGQEQLLTHLCEAHLFNEINSTINQVLINMGLIDKHYELTKFGQKLAKVPPKKLATKAMKSLNFMYHRNYIINYVLIDCFKQFFNIYKLSKKYHKYYGMALMCNLVDDVKYAQFCVVSLDDYDEEQVKRIPQLRYLMLILNLLDTIFNHYKYPYYTRFSKGFDQMIVNIYKINNQANQLMNERKD